MKIVTYFDKNNIQKIDIFFKKKLAWLFFSLEIIQLINLLKMNLTLLQFIVTILILLTKVLALLSFFFFILLFLARAASYNKTLKINYSLLVLY